MVDMKTMKEVIPQKYQKVYNFVGWTMLVLFIIMILGVWSYMIITQIAVFLFFCLVIFFYRFHYKVLTEGMKKE